MGRFTAGVIFLLAAALLFAPVTPRAEDMNSKALTEDIVYLPSGSFLMGSGDGRDNEKPVHRVHLDSFFIDIYPVTNSRYARFLNAVGNHQEGKNKKKWLDTDCKSERKEGMTDEQFYYKTRKKAFGPFKHDLWNLTDNTKTTLMSELTRQFDMLFTKLGI